mgnify:FL=1
MASSFQSKPAPADPFKTSNSTARVAETAQPGDGGADRVGPSTDNPYGPSIKGSK